VLGLALLLACHDGEDSAAIGVAGNRSGGLIFVKEVDGQADLARARIADRTVVVVSRTPQREERWPYWSKVARRVVFQIRSYASSLETDLALWDPESGLEEILASTPARDERWQAWSPVAPQLAYVFKQHHRPSGIALHDLSTGRTLVLASVELPAFFVRPVFSPDGRRLVVQHRPDRSEETDLWLIEPGWPARRLTSSSAVDTKARFLPDGRSILFTRRPERMMPRDLILLDLASGTETRFASLPTAEDHSAWPSPTRDEVAFVSDRDGSRDVFLVDLADGVPRNLTKSPMINEGAPLWSPDGERLVILLTPKTKPGRRLLARQMRIAVIDRDGRTLFETQGAMADWMPAWPADSAR
jgi:Tol biopolymer transport system component